MRFAEHNVPVDEQEVAGWFAGRVPPEWFTGPAEVKADAFEILVVGTLPDVEGVSEAGAAAAREGRINQFREDTRAARVRPTRLPGIAAGGPPPTRTWWPLRPVREGATTWRGPTPAPRAGSPTLGAAPTRSPSCGRSPGAGRTPSFERPAPGRRRAR